MASDKEHLAGSHVWLQLYPKFGLCDPMSSPRVLLGACATPALSDLPFSSSKFWSGTFWSEGAPRGPRETLKGKGGG